MIEHYRDELLVRELRKRGYVVRLKSEARRTLTWNRSLPVPDNIDFKEEALAKIREMLAIDMLEIEERKDSYSEVITARLRLFS